MTWADVSISPLDDGNIEDSQYSLLHRVKRAIQRSEVSQTHYSGHDEAGELLGRLLLLLSKTQRAKVCEVGPIKNRT
jgi:hypothetical protein